MSERPLEVGDEVVVHGHHYASHDYLDRVAMVTKTQAIVLGPNGTDARYNRITGSEVGDFRGRFGCMDRRNVSLATDDDRQRIAKRQAKDRDERRRREVLDLVTETLKTCSMPLVEQIAALAMPPEVPA